MSAIVEIADPWHIQLLKVHDRALEPRESLQVEVCADIKDRDRRLVAGLQPCAGIAHIQLSHAQVRADAMGLQPAALFHQWPIVPSRLVRLGKQYARAGALIGAGAIATGGQLLQRALPDLFGSGICSKYGGAYLGSV